MSTSNNRIRVMVHLSMGNNSALCSLQLRYCHGIRLQMISVLVFVPDDITLFMCICKAG